LNRQHQEAAVKDIPAILNSLKLVPEVLTGFIEGIPEEELHLRRGQGFWTIAEHLKHLAELQPVFRQRIQAFFDQEKPVVTPTNVADTPSQGVDVAQVLKSFQAGREKVVELLGQAPAGVWSKQGAHPRYKSFDFHFMVRHILVHDYWHMHRIEDLWQDKDETLKPL
jgi:uncharacterized damage-inducible protein DinB